MVSPHWLLDRLSLLSLSIVFRCEFLIISQGWRMLRVYRSSGVVVFRGMKRMFFRVKKINFRWSYFCITWRLSWILFDKHNQFELFFAKSNRFTQRLNGFFGYQQSIDWIDFLFYSRNLDSSGYQRFKINKWQKFYSNIWCSLWRC